ncbi:MAG: sigma-54-dependent Fis family transcriptional regulator, partial [Deltaproteobacteria bacterium]
VILCEGDTITADLFSDKISAPKHAPVPEKPAGPEDLSIKRATAELESRLIRAALERTGGNRTQAAKLLEISTRTLIYKLKDYGIQVD